MKRLIVRLVFLLSLGPAFAADRPNVLFIFNDDQRADTIAALGNPVIRTPNLDRLCRQGMAFSRAYMQGGFNGATCVPSRAMLLSGQSLFHADEKLLRHQTWPAAFGQAGYVTFATGKWHNGTESLPLSFQAARAIFAGGMTDPLKAPLSNLEDGKLTKPRRSAKHACAVFADEAVRFLKKHRDGPFFCYVAFDGPHDPHVVPANYPVRYTPDQRLLPPNFLPLHPFDNGEMTVRDEMLLPHPRTAEAVEAMNADYYRYISFLDLQIGRILDALAASPYASNTFVVFSADSGVARGSHGLIGKQNLYEHSVRVPLIIAGPGIPAGTESTAMCYLYDVLPTLGKLCGVTDKEPSEAREFSATLRDPSRPSRSELVFAYRGVQRAIRDDRWKLIRYPQINKTQLFDLQEDPFELHNLAGKPESGAKVQELVSRLESALTLYGDKCALTVPNPKPAAWSPPADKAQKERTALPSFARGLPKEDMAFLRDMTRDVVEASRVKPNSNGGGRWPLTNSCGFTLITPGKDTYTAFWVRDFSMAVDSGFVTPEDLRNHLLLICKAQNGPAELKLANGLHVPAWAIPDHINYDGRPSFYPGTYSSGQDQGNGACGRVPPIDDHYEFVHIAYTCWMATRDTSLFDAEVNGVTVWARLETAFACPTTDPETGLAETTEADRAVGFGFCDGETHTGKLLFASLLRYRAAGELAELASSLGHRERVAGYRQVQKTIRANVVRTFSDPQSRDGWLRASTGLSGQPDVWGTLFALHLGVLDRASAAAARTTVADAVRKGTITLGGGVRQVPTDRDFSKTTAWERSMCALNTYQNGGYWHTASGWLIEALWKQDRPLALQVFGEMLAHLRAQDFRKGPGYGAPWEVFGPNGQARQNGVYMASVALPYGILRGF
jgi:arylsulfatase A-like enzyme